MFAGLVYGAAIGDAIGLATRGMDKDQCKFHYTDQLTLTDIVQDEERIHWRKGDWTSNFDQFVRFLSYLQLSSKYEIICCFPIFFN